MNSEQSSKINTHKRGHKAEPRIEVQRIVFLTGVRVTGTSPHHLNPAIALSRLSQKVAIIAPADSSEGTDLDPEIANQLSSTQVNLVPRNPSLTSRLAWYLKAVWIGRKLVQDVNPNFFFVYGSQATAIAILLWPFFPKRSRLVYYTQDYLEPWRYPARALLEALICRRADYVMINERNRGRALQSIYGLKRRPFIVPTGLLSDWPVPHRSETVRNRLIGMTPSPVTSGEEIILIMHQGPLRKNRCGIELLGALATLPDNFRLVVTGMTRSELRSMADPISPDLANRVALPGSLAFQDLLQATASCDMGVLLYPDDGIGNFYQLPGRLSENCRCGIPSISSSTPSFEIIASQNPFLETCDSSAPSEIAGAIERLGNKDNATKNGASIAAREYALKALAYERGMEAAIDQITSE